MIRGARPADASAITAIYNYYIENSVATFEVSPVTVDEMEERVRAISSDYPFLVAESEGAVRGYAYLNRWNNRCAYSSTVESTVYVGHEHTGRGVGRKLYEQLLEHARGGRWHAVIAGVSLPNPASVALHESFGFVRVAHFRETGYKFDRWIDVGYWELLVGAR